MTTQPVSRRRLLAWGLGGGAAALAAGATGVELVLHDVLPGHDDSFWRAAEPNALAFVTKALAR